MSDKSLFQPEYLKDEDGVIRAMHVRVRQGFAVRAVQPNPNFLVYFYLGSDGLPVGFKFLEPVAGVAISRVVYRFMTTADGSPLGISTESDKHFFLTLADAIRIAMNSGEASEALATTTA